MTETAQYPHEPDGLIDAVKALSDREKVHVPEDMVFCPLHDNVAVLREEPRTRTKGGLFLPEQSAEKPAIGRVIAVGPGRQDGNGFHATTVKPGEQVLVARYGGQEVELDGKKILIVREGEILGVMRPAS